MTNKKRYSLFCGAAVQFTVMFHDFLLKFFFLATQIVQSVSDETKPNSTECKQPNQTISHKHSLYIQHKIYFISVSVDYDFCNELFSSTHSLTLPYWEPAGLWIIAGILRNCLEPVSILHIFPIPLKLWSSGLCSCVVLQVDTGVSEEHNASHLQG